MAYDVFISYRRQGGGADARMLYDRRTNAGYMFNCDIGMLSGGCLKVCVVKCERMLRYMV